MFGTCVVIQDMDTLLVETKVVSQVHLVLYIFLTFSTSNIIAYNKIFQFFVFKTVLSNKIKLILTAFSTYQIYIRSPPFLSLLWTSNQLLIGVAGLFWEIRNVNLRQSAHLYNLLYISCICFSNYQLVLNTLACSVNLINTRPST